MSRGVVLWPDAATDRSVRALWTALEEAGVPTLLTRTHRRHRPHVSLVVAEDLDPEVVRGAVGRVPRRPLPFDVHSVGLFPQGVLFLACVPGVALLEEHRRVSQIVTPLATGPTPYSGVGTWVPHLTLGWQLTAAQVALALPVVTSRLPLRGVLAHGGVEDGATGRRWLTA